MCATVQEIMNGNQLWHDRMTNGNTICPWPFHGEGIKIACGKLHINMNLGCSLICIQLRYNTDMYTFFFRHWQITERKSWKKILYFPTPTDSKTILWNSQYISGRGAVWFSSSPLTPLGNHLPRIVFLFFLCKKQKIHSICNSTLEDLG